MAASAHRIETVVAGAGVVGLAVAKALAEAGHEVVVLEAANAIGTGTSSRSSEVIHAGLYYPRGGLKALTCVRGRALLYAYAERRGVPHRRIGKLVVATDTDEIPDLERVAASASANGVDDLAWLSAEQARLRAPGLRAAAALLSPSTGIIDGHALMLAYRMDAEAAGASIVFATPVESAEVKEDGFRLATGGRDPAVVHCRRFVNAAGLGAVELARRIGGLAATAIPAAYLCKGSYFALAAKAPFDCLVYPVPEHAGLGVHLTLDLAGRARFGPDVEWVDAADYAVDVSRGARFYGAIRRYWPGLPDNALQPDYAGMRPKISGPAEPSADFRIDGAERHGVAGLVNLFGIESPGLTASPAIAERVATMLA